jgi:hypothetical protein
VPDADLLTRFRDVRFPGKTGFWVEQDLTSAFDPSDEVIAVRLVRMRDDRCRYSLTSARFAQELVN